MEMITHGFGFDREAQLKSLRWIAGMSDDPFCVSVLCSHDTEIKPGCFEL